MSLFFGFLTLGANALTLLVLGALVGQRLTTARWATQVLATVRPAALGLVALITVTASLGSLWMSNWGNLTPCRLCWYQRTMMYPLAIVSLLAAIRRDRAAVPYAIALGVVGLAVSSYHYTIEWFPDLEQGACAVAVPCTSVWFREFGFMSLSYMAASAFIAALVLLGAYATRTPTIASPSEENTP